MDQMYYDCFTTHLVDNGNVEMTYEKFDDIYSAMIYAYKKSFVKFLANVPNKNQMYPGYQYRSVIRRFTMVFYDEVYHQFPKFENNKIIVYHIKIRLAKVIQKYFREHLKRRVEAALVIQKQFRESIANPYHLMCRRRLLREFKEMGTILTNGSF